MCLQSKSWLCSSISINSCRLQGDKHPVASCEPLGCVEVSSFGSSDFDPETEVAKTEGTSCNPVQNFSPQTGERVL